MFTGSHDTQRAPAKGVTVYQRRSLLSLEQLPVVFVDLFYLHRSISVKSGTILEPSAVLLCTLRMDL